MLQTLLQKRLSATLHNEKGQSAVEYLVICTALVTLFLMSSSQDSIYNMISHTIHDKYSSYAFSVSISDPPGKAFDDAVKQDAAKVKEVLNELKEMEDLIKDTILPDIKHDNPLSDDKKIIKDFKALVKKIIDLF